MSEATEEKIIRASVRILRGKRIPPPVLLIYGQDKIGKSAFGAGLVHDANGKVVGAVDGHRPLFVSTGEEIEQIGVDRTEPCRSSQAVHDALVYAAEDTEHNVVVVDHLSDVERLIHAEVAETAEVADIGAIGYGRGYLSAFAYWEALWGDVERVRASGKCVVLLAHARVQKHEPPDGDSYDQHLPEIHVNSRGEGAGTFIRKKVDVIGFAQLETFTKTVGEGKLAVHKALTSNRRVLRLVGHPSYVAGNRYGLPATIDLSWQAFQDAMAEATK